MAKRSKIGKLIKRSSLMDISIQYGNDKIRFNLSEELIIDENKINSELKEQPSYFGFLCVLQSKLERVREDKKAQLSKTHSNLFINYKGKVDTNTNRVLSNDLAEAKIMVHDDYKAALKNYNKAVENYNIIKSCVDAFYQRSHLIQSLSANVRQEKNNY